MTSEMTMTVRFRYHQAVVSIVFVAFSIGAFAQSLGSQGARQSHVAVAPVASGVNASPKERGELARKFVSKWGMYVQRVYGVRVNTWAQRMVPNFVSVDAANFRSALKRETFEGAMAELSGSGYRLSDDKVITQLALTERETVSSESRVTIKSLGALSNDLVYTPIQPCRIIDTRNTGAGVIAANSTRSFIAINSSNFTSQGGSATNCGTSGLNATAVAINLTAVAPAGAGYATVYPFGTTQPLAASVNYATGAIVNSALIAQIPNPLASFDFTVYTFAQSHYVADIVGYFAPPVATALQCEQTGTTTVTVFTNTNVTASAPACPSGYTRTSTNCLSSNRLMPLFAHGDGFCIAYNDTLTDNQLSASAICCRVPGR
jgi:hypothetical protein